MYDPYGHQQYQQPQLFEDTSNGNYGYDQSYTNSQYNTGGGGRKAHPNQNSNSFGGIPGQFIQDPLVANIAMQYGQNIVGQGREFVDSEIEKIVNVSKIKYYFAVDTRYVLKKLKLLFFPFTHSDWNNKFSNEDKEPVQPRYDINAPDLYIPVMAFVTYILLTGLSLGLQNKFSPDSLGIQASWAVVWLVLELGVILLSFQITAIHSKVQTLHLLALSSYKYVGMILCILCGIAFDSLGYYCALGYSSFSLVVFLFRTLRCQIQGDPESAEGYNVGTKRRFYLLLLMSGLQPIMMWWLTRHLIINSAPSHMDSLSGL